MKVARIRGVLALGMVLWASAGLSLARADSIERAKAAEDAVDPVELTRDWVAMWSSYDLDEVDRLFLKGPELSYFSSEKEGLIQGLEAVREHHVGFGFVSGGKVTDAKLWLEELTAHSFGSTVLVAGIWCFQRGEAPPQRGPVSFLYVEGDGEHRLAHLHFANYE